MMDAIDLTHFFSFHFGMNLKRLIWFSNYRNEKARERPLLNNELDARVLKAKAGHGWEGWEKMEARPAGSQRAVCQLCHAEIRRICLDLHLFSNVL